MLKETSTVVAKQFGAYARMAQHEAVEVTSHDKPYVVIISAQEHERLRKLDRIVLSAAELPDDLVAAIESATPSEESRLFNDEVEG